MELPAQRIRLQFERIRRAVRLYIRGVTWVIVKLNKRKKNEIRKRNENNYVKVSKSLAEL